MLRLDFLFWQGNSVYRRWISVEEIKKKNVIYLLNLSLLVQLLEVSLQYRALSRKGVLWEFLRCRRAQLLSRHLHSPSAGAGGTPLSLGCCLQVTPLCFLVLFGGPCHSLLSPVLSDSPCFPLLLLGRFWDYIGFYTMVIFSHLFLEIYKDALTSGCVVNVGHGFWFYYLIVLSPLFVDSERLKNHIVIITTFLESPGHFTFLLSF